MRKEQPIRVNLSSSFPIRTKCAMCGNKYFYHWESLPLYYDDVATALWVARWYTKYVKRMAANWYLKDRPSDLLDKVVGALTFVYPGQKYNPKMHRIKGAPPIHSTIDVISCACGQHMWYFSQTSTQDRKEITQRKSRYDHPNKYYP